MTRWNRIGWMGAVAGLGLAVTTLFLSNSKPQAVAQSPAVAARQASGKLIVHEWGTFTSFSGSNGVQLDFRPLINEDLPDFVLDRQIQNGYSLLSKGRIRAQIRMETPVTYFYTDVERKVRAKVEFPDGLLTEFYPPVVAMAPDYDPAKEGRGPFTKSMLDWGEIDLIPVAKMAPNVKDEATRNWLLNIIAQRVTPTEGKSNHYYHARETDSAFVHVRREAGQTPNFLVKPHGDYLEKFLFYRGVGRFEQPLKAVVAEDGRIQVTNPGQQPIRSLFRVTVAGNQLSYAQMESLPAGATAEFGKTTQPITLEDLQSRVVAALVGEELYPREATAMVRTWADSWFAEEGTRIFYMVPRQTTDQLLPLTISPAPDESVRVLVGRVEVMPPSVEKQLLEVVRARSVRRAELTKEHADSKEPMPALPIPVELTKLGRLAEPALVRIRELASDAYVSYEATLLLRECRAALDKEANQSVSDASE